MRDHPLWEAIKALRRARRLKAHPAFVERLEQRVKEEARAAVDSLGECKNLPLILMKAIER